MISRLFSSAPTRESGRLAERKKKRAASAGRRSKHGRRSSRNRCLVALCSRADGLMGELALASDELTCEPLSDERADIVVQAVYAATRATPRQRERNALINLAAILLLAREFDQSFEI